MDNGVIAEMRVQYGDFSITITSIDDGKGCWFLEITVDSFSVTTQFRFTNEHMAFEEMIEFANGEKPIRITNDDDDVIFDCDIIDGNFVFSTKESRWTTSFEIPIEVISWHLRAVIVKTRERGYSFATGRRIIVSESSED